MLRFPYNETLTLITSLGIISGSIIKATNEYIVLTNVIYDSNNLGGPFYFDRSEILGFKKEEKIVKPMARIIQFKRDING